MDGEAPRRRFAGLRSLDFVSVSDALGEGDGQLGRLPTNTGLDRVGDFGIVPQELFRVLASLPEALAVE